MSESMMDARPLIRLAEPVTSGVRRFAPRPHAGVRVVCLPHADGAASGYRRWALDAPWDVEFAAVQYPGREDRFAERVPATMAELVSRVTAELLTDRSAAIALFGHSIGALVAYEVALRLTTLGRPPVALIVSGQPAPRLHRGGTVHLGTDDELIADLRMLGGAERPVAEDTELLAAMLPAIRGDYALSETYVPGPRRTLPVPVTVLYGDADPEVTAEEAAAWRETTDAGCDIREFGGGHFYLDRRSDLVLNRVLRAVRSAALPAAAWPSTP